MELLGSVITIVISACVGAAFLVAVIFGGIKLQMWYAKKEKELAYRLYENRSGRKS